LQKDSKAKRALHPIGPEHTYEGLIRSFEYFGGVSGKVLVDNQKSAVLEHRVGQEPRFNRRFLDLAGEHGFRMRACKPGRAQIKGKDERMVGYVKGNFFVRYGEFESWGHLEQLMTRLARARHEKRLERALQQHVYPKVMVLDELGYLSLSREGASLFFWLLARRYERASLIVTSNKSFLDWGEIFQNHVLATAILDRLLHHATTLNIKGKSYRLKEKRRAGLTTAQ